MLRPRSVREPVRPGSYAPIPVSYTHLDVYKRQVVEGRIRDPMSPAQLLRLRSGLSFLQHRDDLFFSKSLRLHCPLPLNELYYRQGLRAGVRSKALSAIDSSFANSVTQFPFLRVVMGRHVVYAQRSGLTGLAIERANPP